MMPIKALFGSSNDGSSKVTLLGRVFDTTGGNRTIGVFAPIGSLIIVFVAMTGTTTVTSLTDNQGGTYASIGVANKNSSADAMYMYARNQAVASAAQHDITLTTPTSTGSGLAAFSVTNMTNFGGAAIRTNGGQQNQTTNTTPAPVLGGAALGTKPVFLFFYSGANSTPVVRTGYTQHFAENYNTPTTLWQVASKNTGETAQTMTWGGAAGGTAWGAYAVELQ